MQKLKELIKLNNLCNFQLFASSIERNIRHQKLRNCWVAKKLMSRTSPVKFRVFRREFLRNHSMNRTQIFRENECNIPAGTCTQIHLLFSLGAHNLSRRIRSKTTRQANHCSQMATKTQPRGTSFISGTPAKSIHSTQDWRRPARWSTWAHARVHELHALPASNESCVLATCVPRSWGNLRCWVLHEASFSKNDSCATDGSRKREVGVRAAWRVARENTFTGAAHEAFWRIGTRSESDGSQWGTCHATVRFENSLCALRCTEGSSSNEEVWCWLCISC